MKVYQLSKQKNIRDLGGLKTTDGRHIRYGRLFRGGLFNHVSEEDIKILESMHLTDVIDFRDKYEFVENPAYHLKGVTYHCFPTLNEEKKQSKKDVEDGNLLWFIGDHSCGHNHMKFCYRMFVENDKSRQSFIDFLKFLEQEDKVVYFHCSQGKDRTGFAAYILEIALGVSDEEAKKDYLYTNIAMEQRVEMHLEKLKDKSFFNESYRTDLIDVFSAKIEYLEESIKAIEQNYGSVINFIRNGLKIDIEKLRAIYLE